MPPPPPTSSAPWQPLSKAPIGLRPLKRIPRRCADHPPSVALPRLVAAVQIMRQALESEFVSAHLHQWIDLVFGYRQQGREAEKALNVFHPLTYEGTVDWPSLQDACRCVRDSIETQVNGFGQVCPVVHPSASALFPIIHCLNASAPSWTCLVFLSHALIPPSLPPSLSPPVSPCLVLLPLPLSCTSRSPSLWPTSPTPPSLTHSLTRSLHGCMGVAQMNDEGFDPGHNIKLWTSEVNPPLPFKSRHVLLFCCVLLFFAGFYFYGP